MMDRIRLPGRKITKNVEKHFNIMVNALQKEDKDLREMAKRVVYEAKHFFGGGICFLEEKHLQYILFRSLLKSGDLEVYIEEPYRKGKMKCDLTLYDPGSELSIWIEIKAAGRWESIPNKASYWRWINKDLKKLCKLNVKEGLKWLLLTWIESESPDESRWKASFEKNLKGITFEPSLFRYFQTVFSDGKRYCHGYYAISLLAVP